MPDELKRAVRLSALAWQVPGVVGLLFLLLFPAHLFMSLINSGGSRRRHPCLVNLKELSLAIVRFEAANGHYTPAFLADERGRPVHSWRVLILPYLNDPEAQRFYEQYRFDEPWNGDHNRRLSDQMPDVFRCPDEVSNERYVTSYVAVVGPDTMWPGAQARKVQDVVIGVSKAILLVEMADSGIHWMEPRDLDQSQLETLPTVGGANHPGGRCASRADGSSGFFAEDIPADVWIRRILVNDVPPEVTSGNSP